jgi:rhodanese-related sulfurtransferase
MKKLLVILMAVAVVFAATACQGGNALESAATNYFAEFPGNRIVTWDDLFAKIDAGDEPFILSIRQNDVYSEGHINGAYLASWGTDLAEKVSMLPTDEPVYVYCYSGQTAGQTVALLNILGVEAYSVKSGYNLGASKTEGFEAYVETDANELPDAGAKFNKDVLSYVEEYFNTVADNANNIMAADAAAPLIEAGDLTVMDIRSADDYAAGHIEGAVNVPFGSGMQEKFADFEGKKIIATCYSGQTAGQTVAVLRALGYEAVSLKSGMGGWTSYVKSAAANAYFAPEFCKPHDFLGRPVRKNGRW